MDLPWHYFDFALDVQTWKDCPGKISNHLHLFISLFQIKMLKIYFKDKCESKDTDLPGHDIGSVLDVPSWEKCSTLCSENSDCFFWTWVDDSYTLDPAVIHKCYLKNGHSGSTPIQGLVSGSAGCKLGKSQNYQP